MAVPNPSPRVTKSVLIDIIVPRDSGVCLRVKFMLPGKPMPYTKAPRRLRVSASHKSETKAKGGRNRLETAKDASLYSVPFHAVLLSKRGG